MAHHPWDELGLRGAQTDAERITQIAILKFSTEQYSGLTFAEIWDKLLVEYRQWQDDCRDGGMRDPGDDATPLDPALRNKG